MFIKNPEVCDTKYHRSIVLGVVSMRRRGKVCKYVAGRNDQNEKASVICDDNQGANILAKNRQVGICTKHNYIRCRFLQYMIEDKDIDIQYI